MLITKNNEKKRELVEQVQYLTDYHNQDKALASWGIRIVGQIESESELPSAETYTGAYGDAYAVGQEAPFDFYIFTRSSLAGSGDYWFPFGQISIAGPQGPQGVQGEKGDTGESSKWYVGSNVPQPTTLYKPGDMYLNVSTGNVYQFTDNEVWLQVANVIGPQGPRGLQGESIVGPEGPQGPKGERGDVAGLVNIRGQLTSESQLPSPESLNNLTVAYLINGDLWIQFGETPEQATWNNVGPFNVGTMVTVDGTYVNILEMNDYIAKPESTFHSNRVPGILAGSLNQYYYTIAQSDQISSINTLVAYKDSNSGVKLPATSVGYLTTANPINAYHCANKYYVDNAIGQLHPQPETVFEYRIAIQPNEEVSMTYIGTQGLFNFRWMTISMDMGDGEYVVETLPISAISETYSFTVWKTTYPSKFTIQLENVNSPSPTMKLTNLTGRTNGGARLNVVCF